MGKSIDIGNGQLWVEQRGEGPDVLLIGGLGDPIEAWEPQLEGLSDRYRITAFDNRGTGRSPLGPEEYTVPTMADDAAAVLRAMDISGAHVAGFSGGSLIGQELALRHPELVRSLVLMSTYADVDPYLYALYGFFRLMPEVAPKDRDFLEAFFLWVYTPRAHANGMVEQIIEETLVFPHPTSIETMQRQVDAFRAHDAHDRLPDIEAPALVLAGELDILAPPRMGRIVAERIPNATFELMPGEAHQPFQESPDDFNTRVDEFWRSVDGAG